MTVELSTLGAIVKTAYEAEANTNAFTDALASKLGLIEASATADQTGAEIKAAYEAEVNAFTDALFTKLSNIETAATADQTGAEIKAAYEAEVNAFTDALFTKLSNIETAATADQTGAEIKAAYEAELNAFTDALFTKLSNIETAATADQTDGEIKTAYENNADTNAYTDAEQTKVGNISITQAVDLDAIETRVNALDAAVILMGTWDASVGTFPGGGTAQAGETWIVSTGGTIDSVVFNADDRIICLTDNASTTVYATNWHKADYTDMVLSVAGITGTVGATALTAALDLAGTSTQGLVPQTGTPTGKFLKDDMTWAAPAGGGDALTTDTLAQFAATTSLQLKGVISDETGSGALVFANSPTFINPALGTPASGVATNLTGTAAGLTAGNVTTNANLTGHITSVGNAAVLGTFSLAQLSAAISDGTISGNNSGDEPAASLTVAGVIEIATIAETDTGSDATRAVSPDGLAGSVHGKEVITVCLFDDSEDTATGDGAGDQLVRIPSKLNGWNLIEVAAYVQTAGTTGTLDVQIHNVTQAADMLTTKLTIDSTETDTSTAATAAVIDTANDDVATGDKIRYDVDAVQTTAAKGLWVEMTFQKP